MNDLIATQLKKCKADMSKALDYTESELTKIRAGKASPDMLDGILVDYYGTDTPLSQVSNINTTDARTIVVKPWEKTMIGPIEKAILDSNIGITPQNDGDVIHLNIPPLTEERRKDLVKNVKEEAEKGKVVVRNIRKETNDAIKKLKSEGISEDELKAGEDEVQKLTDHFTSEIDKTSETKEKDIMTI